MATVWEGSAREDLIWDNADVQHRAALGVVRTPAQVRDDMLRLAREIAVARDSDPETSHEAARSVGPLRQTQVEVLEYFEEHGAMSHEQLWGRAQAAGSRQTEQGTRTRCRELVDVGLIRHVGFTTNSRRERVRVWEAVRIPE